MVEVENTSVLAVVRNELPVRVLPLVSTNALQWSSTCATCDPIVCQVVCIARMLLVVKCLRVYFRVCLPYS